MRNKFGEQLERLHVEMIQIGALCEDAISAAAKALMNGDETLAQTAQEAEREIDEKEREVESLCLKLLLQQQPVARDLREVSSALDPISTSKIEDLVAELKNKYTIIMVTHNMQQAARVSDNTAFFLLGDLVEFGRTDVLFSTPADKRTEDYITGRFG